jgi:hypothetical protein
MRGRARTARCATDRHTRRAREPHTNGARARATHERPQAALCSCARSRAHATHVHSRCADATPPAGDEWPTMSAWSDSATRNASARVARALAVRHVGAARRGVAAATCRHSLTLACVSRARRKRDGETRRSRHHAQGGDASRGRVALRSCGGRRPP